MFLWRNAEVRCFRETVVALEKQQVLHIASECESVALVIQYAKRMRQTMLL
jgi:hypothetical protein